MKQVGELFGKPVFTGRDVQRTFKKEDYIYLPSDKIEDLKKEGVLDGESGDSSDFDPFNGYEYVDLGLPSGTLWGKYNIGANIKSHLGLYFSWGDIKGCYTNYNFTINSYNDTPASNIQNDLTLNEDIANANMQGLWRMPTKIDFDELKSNTTIEIVNNYDNVNITGYLLTSKINNKQIFLPFSGRIKDASSISQVNYYGYYWTSTYNNKTLACGVEIGASKMLFISNKDRYVGYNIRPVISLQS